MGLHTVHLSPFLHSCCNTKASWQESKRKTISCKTDTFARILRIFSLKFLTAPWQIAFPSTMEQEGEEILLLYTHMFPLTPKI